MAKVKDTTKHNSRGKQNRAPRKAVSRRNAVEDSREGEKLAADNDMSWHMRNPVLAKAAASLPFAQSLGTPITMPGTPSFLKAYDNVPVPGLCTLRYIATPGSAMPRSNSSSATSPAESYNAPINIAARNIYSFVRSANSGSKIYDAPNLMMYLFGAGQAFAYYSFLVRAYGCLNLYAARNRYLPRTLIRAMGLNFESLYSQQAQFRYYINAFAAKASSLCVPKVMDYYQRLFWLTQNIFADGPTSKAQIYMYSPLCFWKYIVDNNLVDTYGPGKFVPTDNFTPDSNYGLDDLIRIGNEILDPLLVQEDYNVMSGDILKAYGAGELFALAPIGEQYYCIPAISEEIMMQVHNANILDLRGIRYSTSATQFDGFSAERVAVSKSMFIGERIEKQGAQQGVLGYLTTPFVAFLTTRGFTGGTGAVTDTDRARDIVPACLLGDQLINSHKDDVSPEDVMAMTRLMVTVKASADAAHPNYNNITVDSCGTEIVTGCEIYVNEYDTTTRELVQNVEYLSSGIVAGSIAAKKLAHLSAFEMFPILQIVDRISPFNDSGAHTETAVERFGWHGEMENYTTVSPEVLKRIHEASLLSLFNIPYYGAF